MALSNTTMYLDEISVVIRRIHPADHPLKMICNPKPIILGADIISKQYKSIKCWIYASTADFIFFRKNGFIKPGDLLLLKKKIINVKVIHNQIVLITHFSISMPFIWITNQYLDKGPIKITEIGIKNSSKLQNDYKNYNDHINYKQYFIKNPIWKQVQTLSVNISQDSTFDHKQFIRSYKRRKRKLKQIKPIKTDKIPTKKPKKRKLKELKPSKSDEPPTKKQKKSINELKNQYKEALHVRLVKMDEMDKMNEKELSQRNKLAIQIEQECKKQFPQCYASKMRDLSYNIAKNDELRMNIINNVISKEVLVGLSNEELQTRKQMEDSKKRHDILLKEKIRDKPLDFTKQSEYRKLYKPIVDDKEIYTPDSTQYDITPSINIHRDIAKHSDKNNV